MCTLRRWLRAGAVPCVLLAAGCSDSPTDAPVVQPDPPPPHTVYVQLDSGQLLIEPGYRSSVGVTVRRLGYADALTLTVAGVPEGVTASFAPTVLTDPGSAGTLILEVMETASSGTYTLRIAAAGPNAASPPVPLILRVTERRSRSIELVFPDDEIIWTVRGGT